ncbi:AAA family ATPase [Stackebrandtia endophytica]|uniref:AAA family ATPase n=1 Tax=Stackebrandtia endophytica TaxID=1496996 RepID=UPI00147705D1|nr:AAA family ATPase [Stackebrandtia endophytica]
MQSRLILVTGAQAAGKTTIARAMARRLDRAVHIDGDVIHGFVAAGEVPFDLPPPPGAMEQLYLRYRGSLAVAREYLAAGFDAIVSDNMFGQQLTDVVDLAAALTERVHVIVLDPSESTIEEREAGRDKVGYSDSITPAMLIAAVRQETPRLGLWHDSSGESVDETARSLLDNLGAARVVTANDT